MARNSSQLALLLLCITGIAIEAIDDDTFLVHYEQEIQSFSFSKSPESNLNYGESSQDGERVILTDDTMPMNLKSLWQRLLYEETDLLNIFMILLKIRDLSGNENYTYNGITSTDIKQLIQIKPLRLSNCLVENMKARRVVLRNPELRKYPNLVMYIEFFNDRAFRTCWDIQEEFVNELAADEDPDLDDDIILILTRLHSTISDETIAQNATSSYPRALATILVNHIMRSNSQVVRGKRMRSDRYQYHSHSQLKGYIKRLLGRSCYIANRVIDHFTTYYDAIAQGDSFQELQFNPSPSTVQWMAAGRLCRTIFNNEDLINQIWNEFCLRTGISVESASEIFSDPEEHEELDEYSLQNLEQYDSDSTEANVPSSNPLVSPSGGSSSSPTIRLTPDDVKPMMKHWDRVLSVEPISVSQMWTHLNMLRRYYRNQEAVFAFEHLNTNDIKSICRYSIMKIENCYPDEMIIRFRMLKNPKYVAHKALSSHIHELYLRQDRACWKLFATMLMRNVNTLRPETRQKMYSLNLSHWTLVLGHEEGTLAKALAQLVINEPKFETFITPFKKMPTVREFTHLLQDIFGKHCSHVRDATGSYIDYYDMIHNENPMRTIPLNSTEITWLEHGRICRAIISEGRFTEHVRDSAISTVAWNVEGFGTVSLH